MILMGNEGTQGERLGELNQPNDGVAPRGSVMPCGSEMRRTPSSTLLVDLCRTLQSPADGTPSFIGCLSTVASSQPPPKGCRSSYTA